MDFRAWPYAEERGGATRGNLTAREGLLAEVCTGLGV